MGRPASPSLRIRILGARLDRDGGGGAFTSCREFMPGGRAARGLNP